MNSKCKNKKLQIISDKSLFYVTKMSDNTKLT